MNGQGDRKIPVIIITGFLGSGKTTVLNHVVKQASMKSTAVIINEFGEIGIDHLLVETSTEQMIELNNGCICCTVRGDLVDKLGSLAMWLDMGRVPPVDRVIVETTGLADPAPIMHTLMTDETLLDRYRLEGIVTVVDAIAGASSLERFSEAVKQIAIADRLILSKRDLVETHSDWKSYAELRRRIEAINPRVAIHEANHGEIDLEILIRRGESDAKTAFADFSEWLDAAERECHQTGCGDPGHRHSHGHDTGGITSFVVRFTRIADGEKFNRFLQELAIEFGENILRVKGIINVAEKPDNPAVIHGVQHVFFPVSWLDAWPDDDHSSKLVFITQGVAPRTIENRFAEHFV
jgi:G3E family GTPase